MNVFARRVPRWGLFMLAVFVFSPAGVQGWHESPASWQVALLETPTDRAFQNVAATVAQHDDARSGFQSAPVRAGGSQSVGNIWFAALLWFGLLLRRRLKNDDIS